MRKASITPRTCWTTTAKRVSRALRIVDGARRPGPYYFTACAQQIGSGKNVPLPHTLSNCLLCAEDVRRSVRVYRRRSVSVVRVYAPEGSIVNPLPPAAVSSLRPCPWFATSSRTRSVKPVRRDELRQVDRFSTILSGWDPRKRCHFIDYGSSRCRVLPAVRPHGRGADSHDQHLEPADRIDGLEFPVRVERYELRRDSGGAGEHRGGLGVLRDVRMLGHDITVALQRPAAVCRVRARGRRQQALGSFLLNPGSVDERRLPSTLSATPLQTGDVLRVLTPGGGGFGPPAPDPGDVERTGGRSHQRRILADVLWARVRGPWFSGPGWSCREN